MLASIFWNILGLLIQVVGAFMCIRSFVFATPKVITDALASIHGNRLRDRDLNRNQFLDGLIRQSFDAQNGFTMIIIGALIQAVCSLFVCLQTSRVSIAGVIISYVCVPIVLWVVATKVSLRRRQKAQRLISAANSAQGAEGVSL
jgi:hypothetical protein